MRRPTTDRSPSASGKAARPVLPSGNSVGAVIVRRRAIVLGFLGLATAALVWPVVTAEAVVTATSVDSTSSLSAGEATQAQLILEERLPGGDQRFMAEEGTESTLGPGLAGEERTSPGPFLAAGVVALMAIVALVSRSYWSVAVAGASTVALLAWSVGAGRLADVASGPLAGVLAPAVAIGLGATTFLHVSSRVREQRTSEPLVACADGISLAIGPQLAVAAAAGAAVLAPLVSGIDAARHFSIVAATGIVAALSLLGIGAPLAVATVERFAGGRHLHPRGAPGDVLPIMATIVGAGSVTWALLDAAPPVGAIGLAFYVWLAVALPAQRARAAVAAQAAPEGASSPVWLGALARSAAEVPVVTLTLVVAVTAMAGWAATGLTSEAIRSDPDLDGRTGGTVSVLVEGDFTSPQAVGHLERFIDEVDRAAAGMLARGPEGTLRVDRGVLDLLDEAATSGAGDASSRGEVRTILETAIDEHPAWASSPGTDVARSPDGGGYVTAIRFQAAEPGTAAGHRLRVLMDPMVAELEVELRTADDEADARLAGTALVESERAEATESIVRLGLGVALLAVFVVAMVLFRDAASALATTVMPATVAVWVLGIAAALGMPLDLPVAAICLAAVGVAAALGIPLVARFREERPGAGDELHAVEVAATSTEGATVASGVAVAAALGVMASAPSAAVARLGTLGALLAGFAVVSTLGWLPSALTVRTRRAMIAPIWADLDRRGSEAAGLGRTPAVRATPGRPVDDLPPAAPLSRVPTEPSVGRLAERSGGPAHHEEVPVRVEPPAEGDSPDRPSDVGLDPEDRPTALVVAVAPDGTWVDLRLVDTGRSYVGRGEATPRGIVEALVTVMAARDGVASPEVVDVDLDTAGSVQEVRVVLRHRDGSTSTGGATRSGSMADVLLRAVRRAMSGETETVPH